MAVTFYERNFSYMAQPTINLVVQRYTYTVYGGPGVCEILAQGNEDDIWDLPNYLGRHVVVTDKKGVKVFWGYVSAVGLNNRAIQVGLSLENMYNSIAVNYTVRNEEQAMTDFLADSRSVALFGTRQKIHSMNGDTTKALAEALRTNLLNVQKMPAPMLGIGNGGPNIQATIIVTGYMETLNWKYALEATSALEYTETKNQEEQAFGKNNSVMAVAQSFSDSSARILGEIQIPIKKEGSPGDNVLVSLHSDSSGSPGTSLASVTIAGSSIAGGWEIAKLTTPYSLSASTSYWIKITRSGSSDNSNYYAVAVNPDKGYTGGLCKTANNSGTWKSRSRSTDMLFRLIWVRRTSDIISALVTSYGQFLTGCTYQDGATTGLEGVYSPSDFTGDRTALEEVLTLMNKGNGSNRRILGHVTPARILKLYAEPAPGSLTADGFLYLDNDGKLYYNNGAEYPPEYSPVGRWVRLRKTFPKGFDSRRIIDLSDFFIDSSEYSTNEGKVTLTPKNNIETYQVEMWEDG